MPKSSIRVLDTLELLALHQEGLSHAEFAASLRIPKSSLTGVLGDLLARGYISFDATNRRYTLGSQVLTLSRGYLEALSLTRIGRPILTEIVRGINESAALAVRNGLEMLVVAQETCSHPLAHTMTVGSRGPLHSTASGKVLLAWLPEPEINALLDRLVLSPVTRHTKTDRDRLAAELVETRARGWAVSDEEALEGVYAIAAPVATADGVAALSVAIPVARLSKRLKESAKNTLQERAASMSTALGERPFPFAKGGEDNVEDNPSGRARSRLTERRRNHARLVPNVAGRG